MIKTIFSAENKNFNLYVCGSSEFLPRLGEMITFRELFLEKTHSLLLAETTFADRCEMFIDMFLIK